MKTRSLISLITAAAVVAGAALVWTVSDTDAQRGRKARGAHRHQAIMEALDLTAEQQEKLKSLHLDNAKRMTRLKADLKIARLDMRDLLSQTDPNPNQVKTRVAEVNRVRSEILEKRINSQLAKKKIFTPEQLEKMKELRQKRPGMRRRGMRGHGMRGHGGRGQSGPSPQFQSGPPNQPGSSSM